MMLALPIVLQNMITIGVNVADTVMLGSYGEIQLSGSSLANGFIIIFQILCMGMAAAPPC
jgi:Na+-driven multidrug efflux pump